MLTLRCEEVTADSRAQASRGVSQDLPEVSRKNMDLTLPERFFVWKLYGWRCSFFWHTSPNVCGFLEKEKLLYLALLKTFEDRSDILLLWFYLFWEKSPAFSSILYCGDLQKLQISFVKMYKSPNQKKGQIVMLNVNFMSQLWMSIIVNKSTRDWYDNWLSNANLYFLRLENIQIYFYSIQFKIASCCLFLCL